MKRGVCVVAMLILSGMGRTNDTSLYMPVSDMLIEPGTPTSETNKYSSEQPDFALCSTKALDFMLLQQETIQKTFFAQLDSVRQSQYPNNDQEREIMVDLTPEYLEKFLTDLSPDSLRKTGFFEKNYHFNLAPDGYTDPEVCKDKIQITFHEEYCSFRLCIYNTFWVEPNWCTESMVVYVFRIEGNKIIDFSRNEVG